MTLFELRRAENPDNDWSAFFRLYRTGFPKGKAMPAPGSPHEWVVPDPELHDYAPRIKQNDYFAVTEDQADRFFVERWRDSPFAKHIIVKPGRVRIFETQALFHTGDRLPWKSEQQ